MSRSEAEALFDFQIKAAGLAGGMEREYRFHPTRRWRFDFAWPEARVAVEIEGGLWVYGRHNRPRGYEADLEKYAEAVVLGWRVLRVSPRMVEDGRALAWLEKLLQGGEA